MKNVRRELSIHPPVGKKEQHFIEDNEMPYTLLLSSRDIEYHFYMRSSNMRLRGQIMSWCRHGTL
jgi:hypothetical protein